MDDACQGQVHIYSLLKLQGYHNMNAVIYKSDVNDLQKHQKGYLMSSAITRNKRSLIRK